MNKTNQTYTISTKEIARRKRDFAKMLLFLYSTTILTLIDLIISHPATAIPYLIGFAIFFTFLILLTNRTLTKQSKWKIHLSDTQIDRQLGTVHDTYSIKSIKSIRIKRTAKNLIRNISCTLSSGKHIDFSALNHFDDFNTRIQHLGQTAKISDFKESHIDFDNPWWYVFFGSFLGIIFGIIIRLYLSSNTNSLRIAGFATSSFITVVGVLLIWKRPSQREYGRKNHFDLILGPILIISSITTFIIIML